MAVLCHVVRPGSRKGHQSSSGVSQQWQKDLCAITKYLKDKVISKQVSENKNDGHEMGKTIFEEKLWSNLGLTNQKRKGFFLCLCFFEEGQFSPIRETQLALWAL